jgi:hypothetical protein
LEGFAIQKVKYQTLNSIKAGHDQSQERNGKTNQRKTVEFKFIYNSEIRNIWTPTLNKFGETLKKLMDRQFIPTLDKILIRYEGKSLELTKEVLDMIKGDFVEIVGSTLSIV